ncbi:MAG: hypothetical protein WB992_18845 [Bryobacteraceae bacterium]
MAFEPDIIVTGPEPSEIALVAEVNISSRSIEDSEYQLKNYMAAIRSPVGLLVTPEHLRIYRDRYLLLAIQLSELGSLTLGTSSNLRRAAMPLPRHYGLSATSNPGWRRWLPNPALSN